MGKLDRAGLERVARMFQALSDPTRLALLQEIKDRPQTVTELMLSAGVKQANASKQLGILHAAGLVDRQRVGNSVLYSIKDMIVFDLCRLVCGKLEADARRELESLTAPPSSAAPFGAKRGRPTA